MGLRFRRSIKVAPGVRVNISKSGSSISFGKRGATVNVGRRGVYADVEAPGTGLSYRQKIADHTRPVSDGSAPMRRHSLVWFGLLCLFAVFALIHLWPTR